MKKLLALFLTISLTVTMLAGCGGSGAPSNGTNSGSDAQGSGPSANAARTDLNFALLGDPKTLDMTEVSDLLAQTVGNQIYDTLIERTVQGELVPALATSWEFVDDGTAMIFNLREGVKFSNGEPLAVEDVIYTFELVQKSAFTSAIGSLIKSVEKIDDKTVKLIMPFAYGAMEQYITSAQMGIICKSAREADPVAFGRKPVGTGAYQIKEWSAGDKILLDSFEGHWRGAPSIKTVTFKVITDQTASVIALQSGEVDVIDTPPRTERQNLMDDKNIAYYETEIASSVFIAFNMKDEIFSNKLVRQAVSLAIDKEELIMGSVEGLGTPISSPFSPSVAVGWADTLPVSEHNIEKAKAKLAEAGYPNGFTFTMYTTESATYKKPTEVMQGMLKEIGITADIQVLERNTFWDQMQTKREYGAFVCAATTGALNDPDYIYNTYHSKFVEGGRNYFNLSDAKFDEYLDKGRTETDPAKRIKIYTELTEYNIENCFTVPLYTYLTPIAANKDLSGVVANPINKMYIRDFAWI